MAPFLEETDRAVRQTAWELAAERRLEDREALDDLFDQMLALRIEIAKAAGFASFVDFAFRQRERFDYGIDDALRFHSAVENVVVPLARKIQEEHRARLGVSSSRPWDTAVDPSGRPPLKPFDDVAKLALAPRPSSARSTPSSAPSSPSFARRACSTWPTARARPPAAIRPRSRTSACPSSS